MTYAPRKTPVPSQPEFQTWHAVRALAHLLKNKLPAILALLLAMTLYRNIPENHPLPFAELLYVVVVVLAVSVAAPFVRLFVFSEASYYAETGKLDADLTQYRVSPALSHYWFATAVSYLVAFISVLSVLG